MDVSQSLLLARVLLTVLAAALFITADRAMRHNAGVSFSGMKVLVIICTIQLFYRVIMFFGLRLPEYTGDVVLTSTAGLTALAAFLIRRAVLKIPHL